MVVFSIVKEFLGNMVFVMFGMFLKLVGFNIIFFRIFVRGDIDNLLWILVKIFIVILGYFFILYLLIYKIYLFYLIL